MTQEEWPARLARTMAAEVRRFRQVRGMSAQQLADRCAELGMPIARSVLANFESGRRPTLSVAELLVIAQALRVPPVALIVPVGYEPTVEVLPGLQAHAFEAAQWITGESSGRTGAGWAITDQDADDFEGTPYGMFQYREHAQTLATLLRYQQIADDDRKRAARVADSDTELRDALLRAAESTDSALEAFVERLEEIRSLLREDGLTPPPLPRWVHHRFPYDPAVKEAD
ncbi:helix-turn-helix transcriptional regulator [Streptomyces sp. NPDC002039]|uniref:helix-turn-helix domain-containing protein n=1 Tax=Streptomyces sp. NPDC002039 TaxID=3154660 RepID=UPI00332EF6EE